MSRIEKLIKECGGEIPFEEGGKSVAYKFLKGRGMALYPARVYSLFKFPENAANAILKAAEEEYAKKYKALVDAARLLAENCGQGARYHSVKAKEAHSAVVAALTKLEGEES